jgi:hypothetical protein
VDRIKAKLSAWKASLLSIAGRVQLVKSVVYSMIQHTIAIYCWPASLIKSLESLIRNFIWSGDVNQRKLVTVAWHKVCKPTSQGGLGIRSISQINKGASLKFICDFLNSSEDWALLLKSRVLRKNGIISHHISSSLWSSCKDSYADLVENSSWLLGNGDIINFWLDEWCGNPLVHYLQIPDQFHNHLSAKVEDFIVNKHWKFPDSVLGLFPNLSNIVSKISIPLDSKEDTLVWKNSTSGALTFKDAFLFHGEIGQNLAWAKLIWCIDIPPSKSLLSWRLVHDKLPTDNILANKGIHLCSMCSLCCHNQESAQHLFFECSYSLNIWSWLSCILQLNLQLSPLGIWNICFKGWSAHCQVIVLASIINVIDSIWFARNQLRFSNKSIHWKSIINLVTTGVPHLLTFGAILWV